MMDNDFNNDFNFEPPPVLPPQRLRLQLAPVRVVYGLIAINAAFFLLTVIKEDWAYVWGALTPGLVLEYHQWWRLLTSGFLHAGILHIGFNLYALYGLGSLAESFFGTGRLLSIYFVALLGSSVLVALFSSFNTVTVGASGAIMGLLGALLIFYWKYRTALAGGQRYLNELIRMAVINIAIGFTPGISFLGHFGGFLSGALIGWLLCPTFEPEGYPPVLVRRPLEPGETLKALLVPLGLVVMLFLGSLWRVG